MKTKIYPILLLTSFFALAQTPTGYWDNKRITNKEIKLSAGDKVVVKSEDLPVGTTEIAFRITMLDENQKMANDFAGVLKAIPDPYYISKGLGSAISLVSSITGKDKCTYAVFAENLDAFEYVKSGAITKACMFQLEPTNKDAKVISLDKQLCLAPNSKNIWFAFKNENWMMNEKIILEIVPWVDYETSKGWTKSAKEKVSDWVATYLKNKEVSSRSETANFYKSLYKDFEAQQLEYLSDKEKALLYEKYKEEYKTKMEAHRNFYKEAYDLDKKGNYAEAISVLETKVASKPVLSAQEWSLLGELYLKTNQIEKAFITLKNASALYSENLSLKLNLAHAYMFNDEVSASKKIHKQFMTQNISASQTWKNKAINDLEAFKKMSNLPQKNISKIWKLYN